MARMGERSWWQLVAERESPSGGMCEENRKPLRTQCTFAAAVRGSAALTNR